MACVGTVCVAPHGARARCFDTNVRRESGCRAASRGVGQNTVVWFNSRRAGRKNIATAVFAESSTAISTCDVAIVGGGPGGLATALALQKQGLDVRVFEQREEVRPAGVAVFIWPHGLQHLRDIDYETCERVINAGAPINRIAVERLDPGAYAPDELLNIDVAGWSQRMDLPPQIGITWARLTNALREGLEPGTVFLGHALQDVTDYSRDGKNKSTGQNRTEDHGVVLTFAQTRSGAPAPSPVRARLCVVGADGRNSRVRLAVFGDDDDNVDSKERQNITLTTEPTSANVYYALSPNPPPGGNGLACWNELRFSLCDGAGISTLDVGRGNLDLLRDASTSVGKNNDKVSGEGYYTRVSGTDKGTDEVPEISIPDTSGGQVMFGTTRFSEASISFESPSERLKHLKGMFGETTPLLRALIDATEPGEVVQTQLFERNGAKRWSKGRVVLLGDAAHCMYPSLGLGISTAFADAVELSKQIEEMQVTKLSTEDALARYSANRSPNARLLQLVRYVLYFPNPPPCLPIQD